MSARLVLAGIVVSVLSAIPSAAQQMPSLAELARQTEVAKSTKPKAKKSYTNADLHPSAEASAAAPSTGSASAAAAKATTDVDASATAASAAENGGAGDAAKADADSAHSLPEEHWRGRADFIRSQVDKAKAEIARLNLPVPGRSAILEERNANEIKKYQQMIDGAMKQWASLEASARVSKVPAAWIGAAPQ